MVGVDVGTDPGTFGPPVAVAEDVVDADAEADASSMLRPLRAAPAPAGYAEGVPPVGPLRAVDRALHGLVQVAHDDIRPVLMSFQPISSL
jgi:hypothetical protein